MSALDDSFLPSDQDINQFFFLYQRRLNPKYLIQPLKTLLVELTETLFFFFYIFVLELKLSSFIKKLIYI